MEKLHVFLVLVLFAFSSVNGLAEDYCDHPDADEIDCEIYPYDTTFDLQAKDDSEEECLYRDEIDCEIYPYDTTGDLIAKDEYDDEIYPYDTTFDLLEKGMIICVSFNSTGKGIGAKSKNPQLAYKGALFRCLNSTNENLKSCSMPKCFWKGNKD